MALPRTEPAREPGELERMPSVGGLLISGSTVDSRDMPGSCRLPDTEPVSEAVSSWFFLKAADPLPPSADCRKKFGSLAPNDAAMELLDGLASGEDGGSGVLLAEARSGEREATDKGRRMLPDLGLWFHDNVPEALQRFVASRVLSRRAHGRCGRASSLFLYHSGSGSGRARRLGSIWLVGGD